MLKNIDPTITAAIVAAITSIATLCLSFLLKSFWDKHFHLFKLEQEYKYEQRKKLKEILSRNKIQLLNSCESLDFRLWNFTTHFRDRWHDVAGKYEDGGYYFESFVYRFVAVLAWIKKIENEMVYLDTTIATKRDMEFIKFLRLLPQLLSDLILFDGFKYDPNYQTDHIFANNLDSTSVCFVDEDGIYTFPEFEQHFSEIKEHLDCICSFIDGMSPDEDRLRWDRLQLFHITLMVFLSTFGYDFQRTPNEKFKEIITRPRKSRLIQNYRRMIERNKLSDQKEFKRALRIIAK